MKIGACPCCCRPDLALTREGVCFVCRDMIAHGLVEWREDGIFHRSEEALLRINDMRRDLGFSSLGGEGTKEEDMGKDKPKGTCRFCRRNDLAITGRGGCSSCYVLVKSGDIDPETMTMTAKAVDKINELRAMSGMEPLPGALTMEDIEKPSERHTCVDCRHASPAESRERCKKDRGCAPDEKPGEYPGWEPVGQPEEESAQAGKPDQEQGDKAYDEDTVEDDLAEIEVIAAKREADADYQEAKAKVARARVSPPITGETLEVNGLVLPLVRKDRGGQADAPYVLVNRGGKHLSLPKALLARLDREPEALRVYGQAGAKVLALQAAGKDDMEARPLCRKAKSTALIMYAEAVIKDLGLEPGRYPVQILESGILAVDLTRRAA